LTFAKKIGATHTVHFDPKKIVQEIRSICKNGVDFVVEASGNKLAMEKTLDIVNDHGLVVIAGNIGQRDTIRINPFELIKGKVILGTWGGETKPDIDFPFYAHAYVLGKLNLDALVARRVRLEEINIVLSEMAAYQQAGRTIIDFSNS
jgi:S-(hydroxymethyl)glutathione dehydrogenase/alcohol dehydrogenase